MITKRRLKYVKLAWKVARIIAMAFATVLMLVAALSERWNEATFWLVVSIAYYWESE